MSRRNAFTLLELCVVLTLVAVIVAVLFPIYSSGNRTDWRRVKCLSNMKQQGLALLLYAQDYDGQLPLKSSGWMDSIRPYIKNEEMFHCPSLRSDEYGYAFDARMAGKNYKKLKSSDTVLLLLESTNKQKNALSSGEGFAPRHNERGNIVFADGHSKSLRSEQRADFNLKL